MVAPTPLGPCTPAAACDGVYVTAAANADAAAAAADVAASE